MNCSNVHTHGGEYFDAQQVVNNFNHKSVSTVSRLELCYKKDTVSVCTLPFIFLSLNITKDLANLMRLSLSKTEA